MTSKAYRLEIFYERLRTHPAASTLEDARAQLDATLNAVENKLSGVPCNPSNWRTDGRMYPAQDDRMYDVPDRPDLKKLRTVGHVILLRDNGAILIQARSGEIFIDKAGADGKKHSTHRDGFMNRIQKMAHDLEERLPGAQIHVDVPNKAGGSWWLDARMGDHSVDVEWRPATGFGISSGHREDPPGTGFGEGPDEIYPNADADQAFARILEVLEKGMRTQPPREVALRRLREAKHISQVELAELMGVRQATISKMERQTDMNVSTLKRMIAALGGTLEIRARFLDHTVTIDLDQRDDAE